jgi:hypothetical protein
MDRHLAQRVQYLRARVRALAGSGQSSASQSMPLLGPGDEVATVVVAAHDEVGVQPVRTPTGTQAITREVTTRLRRFAPWVLLPMLGAAFAVFMLSRPDETRTTAAASAQPQTIKWYLSTEPPGALVSIDGARQPEATPTTIELPRSEQPVRVRVEKPGFEPAEQVLAPLHSDNFPIFLTPVRQPPTPAADLPIASPVVAAPVAQRDDGRALSMKTRKRQAKPVAEKSSDAAPQKPRSSTDHDLEPPPDFAKYRRRHAGSAP